MPATCSARCYRPLNLIETPILFTTLETAELIKYATNAFLATKITFINEVADLCERVGADVQQVAKGMGLDGRIGKKFLHAGPGYGGSCFPKDTLALLRTGEQHNTHLRIVEAVVGVNEGRKRRMVAQDHRGLGGSVAGKTIAVLGVTFKPGTDDMRESPSLVIVPALQGEGATVRAFDPEGMREAGSCCRTSTGARTPITALEGADAAVILTEWNEFRGLDLERAREVMRAPLADRPAQHLRPGPGRGRRLRLCQHRPAGVTAPAPRRGARSGIGLHGRPGPRFHPTLLREYDIRGIVGSTLHRRRRTRDRPGFGTMVAAAGGRQVVPGPRRPPELARARRGHRRGLHRGRARGAADSAWGRRR